jgi:hypothetical protein
MPFLQGGELLNEIHGQKVYKYDREKQFPMKFPRIDPGL